MSLCHQALARAIPTIHRHRQPHSTKASPCTPYEAGATAGELQRLGYLPGRLRDRHGSWFEFVRDEQDLGELEAQVVALAREFLREVETTEMTTCFKMVTLAALVEADGLLAGVALRELALRSRALLGRSPELFADVAEGERGEIVDLDGGTGDAIRDLGNTVRRRSSTSHEIA
jgi:hypothetical protein